MSDFDLVVIGGGAAGAKGAVQAAYFGEKVASGSAACTAST
jgi:glycerol-3-phosphate dehydrogenase